jgi:hypothetical protein
LKHDLSTSLREYVFNFFSPSVCLQLKSNIESTLAEDSNSSAAASDMDMDDPFMDAASIHSTHSTTEPSQQPSQPSQPSQQPSQQISIIPPRTPRAAVAGGSASIYQRSSSTGSKGKDKGKDKGKGNKGKTSTTSTLKTTTARGHHSDDDEVVQIIDQLQTQQQQSASTQGQIANILDRPSNSGVTDQTTWGTFIGKLCHHVDNRLINDYYTDSLAQVINYMDRSRALPPLPLPPLPPPPVDMQYQFIPLQQQYQLPQQQQQYQPHDQQQQQYPTQQQFQEPQQQQQQTFTTMLSSPAGSSRPGPGPGPGPSGGPGDSSSVWDTIDPSAGQNTPQFAHSDRPASAPMNLSSTSISRLSDISVTLMTPENPATKPKSPSWK